jgi:hypothetical protein
VRKIILKDLSYWLKGWSSLYEIHSIVDAMCGKATLQCADSAPITPLEGSINISLWCVDIRKQYISHFSVPVDCTHNGPDVNAEGYLGWPGNLFCDQSPLTRLQ